MLSRLLRDMPLVYINPSSLDASDNNMIALPRTLRFEVRSWARTTSVVFQERYLWTRFFTPTSTTVHPTPTTSTPRGPFFYHCTSTQQPSSPHDLPPGNPRPPASRCTRTPPRCSLALREDGGGPLCGRTGEVPTTLVDKLPLGAVSKQPSNVCPQLPFWMKRRPYTLPPARVLTRPPRVTT